MARRLQSLFFLILIRPIVYLLIGLNVRNWQRLPSGGPGIIVANHNSHLDTLVLMSLLPLKMLAKLRPVAAADYFLKNKALAWFATNIIGIIPISRRGEDSDPLATCYAALDAGDILILFPEGTRGEPEGTLGDFKRGVQILARNRPDIPVYPVYLHGLGKIFPKGAILPLPFCCDVHVGSSLTHEETGDKFMAMLLAFYTATLEAVQFPEWR
jgi:1-acyl-sn-glycerol-3-phosphate acyltransferase